MVRGLPFLGLSTLVLVLASVGCASEDDTSTVSGAGGYPLANNTHGNIMGAGSPSVGGRGNSVTIGRGGSPGPGSGGAASGGRPPISTGGTSNVVADPFDMNCGVDMTSVAAGGAAGSAATFVSVQSTDCVGKPDGSLCTRGTEFVCQNGNVASQMSCGVAGCLDGAHCAPPGSASAVAEQAASATATQACDLFVDSGCGTCLEESCCSPASTCLNDVTCKALWQCLGTCSDSGCESECAQRYPTVATAVANLLSCASTKCGMYCGVSDPCGAFPDKFGLACGPKLGRTDEPDRLYLCNDGVTAGAVVCAAGCYAAPPGQPDRCNDADPCANDPYDGDACGAGLSPMADRNLLYRCNKQRTVGCRHCSRGCQVSPPGVADYCM